jgi:hypothetical protein
MTTHAAPQLTPAQLLDAGRRAEAEGRPDLAGSFYGHLTQHFADTAEAAVAHDALARVEAWQADATAWPPAAAPYPPRLRPPERDPYATGRALARVLGVLGWMLALAGPAGFPAYLLLRTEAVALTRAELLPLAGGAAGGLVLGFGVVLAAHIARAQFDQAEAARSLVALERVRLGARLEG